MTLISLPSVCKIPRYVLTETDGVIPAFHSHLLSGTFTEYLQHAKPVLSTGDYIDIDTDIERENQINYVLKVT